MEWKIDTGRVGECKASDLRSVLEASRDHWLASQAQYHYDQVLERYVGNAGKPGHPTPQEALQKGAPAADAAKKAHQEKAAALADAMALGIKQACEMADAMGGTVTASVSGHDNPRHASGSPKRLVVSVDQVLP